MQTSKLKIDESTTVLKAFKSFKFYTLIFGWTIYLPSISDLLMFVFALSPTPFQSYKKQNPVANYCS